MVALFKVGAKITGGNGIPAGSGYFIRFGIFVPKGFSRFWTAFLDFAIRLAIWGCRGAIIHTVSR